MAFQDIKGREVKVGDTVVINYSSADMELPAYRNSGGRSNKMKVNIINLTGNFYGGAWMELENPAGKKFLHRWDQLKGKLEITEGGFASPHGKKIAEKEHMIEDKMTTFSKIKKILKEDVRVGSFYISEKDLAIHAKATIYFFATNPEGGIMIDIADGEQAIITPWFLQGYTSYRELPEAEVPEFVKERVYWFRQRINRENNQF